MVCYSWSNNWLSSGRYLKVQLQVVAIKIIALLNIIEQIGWPTIGCITGGQVLSSVSNYTVSVILGIVIINISIVLNSAGYMAIVEIENCF
jgi:purine-cytosine permease-like protein